MVDMAHCEVLMLITVLYSICAALQNQYVISTKHFLGFVASEASLTDVALAADMGTVRQHEAEDWRLPRS